MTEYRGNFDSVMVNIDDLEKSGNPFCHFAVCYAKTYCTSRRRGGNFVYDYSLVKM